MEHSTRDRRGVSIRTRGGILGSIAALIVAITLLFAGSPAGATSMAGALASHSFRTNVYPVAFSTSGIFRAYGYYDDQPGPGYVFLNVHNGSGKRVDVVFDAVLGGTLWETGYIDNNDGRSNHFGLVGHRNQPIHVTRWAPGFLGIPGNGGGEVYFTLPEHGNEHISIDVTG